MINRLFRMLCPAGKLLGLGLGISLFWQPMAAAAQQPVACATNVTVKTGDALSTLAQQFYGDPLAYPRIVDATNAKATVDTSYPTIDNADALDVGWKLCLPGPLTAQTTPAPIISTDSLAALLTRLLTEVDEAQLSALNVPNLRQGNFPGSDLIIEETLLPGPNFNRYLASYQSDDLTIYGLLTIPTGQRPPTGWPVIIVNHGYVPLEHYQSGSAYNQFVDAFAGQNYLVFQPDYRGHGNSDGAGLSLEAAAGYMADVLNAVASVKRLPDADPNRIGMWGHSLGGYLTLRTMVTTDDVQAGVIWASVTPGSPAVLTRWVVTQWPDLLPDGLWGDLIVLRYAALLQESVVWEAFSLAGYEADLSGPIQLHHGSADPIVPPLFSVSLRDQLQAASQPVTYFSYAGDNHNLSLNFSDAIARSVAFFDRHVKGR